MVIAFTALQWPHINISSVIGASGDHLVLEISTTEGSGYVGTNVQPITGATLDQGYVQLPGTLEFDDEYWDNVRS